MEAYYHLRYWYYVVRDWLRGSWRTGWISIEQLVAREERSPHYRQVLNEARAALREQMMAARKAAGL